jgi:Protein of unknown function DUF2834
MTTSQAARTLPTSSKIVCAVYGAIAIAALIATWSQGLAYLHSLSGQIDFWVDAKVTPASRFIAVDIIYFALAAAVLMVIDARRLGIEFVWAYILGGIFIAISVAFPLYLIARELRVGRTGTTQLGAVDTVLLAVLAVAFVGLSIWVDMA